MAAQRWEYKVVRLIDGQKVEELSVTDQKEEASTVGLRDLGKEGCGTDKRCQRRRSIRLRPRNRLSKSTNPLSRDRSPQRT